MQALTFAHQACNELLPKTATWAYMGSQDSCCEMLAMAHIFNELPLLIGSSWPTAACKKCHVSPRMGQLVMGSSRPLKKLHAIPHMGQLAMGLSWPTAACDKLHTSPCMGQLEMGPHWPLSMQ